MNAAVKDVMTTQVVAVRRETTFKEMAAALGQYRVSAFPVVDDATLVGKPDTSEVGRELAHRVRHVQGVVAVRDCFSYPPPAARPPEPASLTSSSGRKPAPAQRPLASPADPDPFRCYPAVGVVTVPGPRERNGDQGCA